MFERKCPKCETIIKYKNNTNLKKGIRNNAICAKCKGRLSVEKRGGIEGRNNPFYGKSHTLETRDKLRKSRLGKPQIISEQGKKNRLEAAKTANHRPFLEVWTERYGKEEADRLNVEWRNKLSRIYYEKKQIKKCGRGYSGYYRGFFFRSLQELTYLIDIIEKNNWEWESAEQPKYRILYDDNGVTRRYNADFIVNTNLMIECKMKHNWNNKYVLMKKEAAEKWCKEHNMTYLLIETEVMEWGRVFELHLSGTVKFSKHVIVKLEAKMQKLGYDYASYSKC